jgi:ribosomal protein S1
MAIRQTVVDITISDLKDGEDLDASDLLGIDADTYGADWVDSKLKFTTKGLILQIQPKNHIIKFKFKSDGLVPINVILKMTKTNIKRIRVPIGQTYEFEHTYKTNTEQVINMYGNVSIDIVTGKLMDILQWGTILNGDINKKLGSSIIVGAPELLKEFPKEQWSALDKPNFEYVMNMDNFMIGSNLKDQDFSDWNVDHILTHENFKDDDNNCVEPQWIQG